MRIPNNHQIIIILFLLVENFFWLPVLDVCKLSISQAWQTLSLTYHSGSPWQVLETQRIPLSPHTSTYWVVAVTCQPSILEAADLQKDVLLLSPETPLCSGHHCAGGLTHGHIVTVLQTHVHSGGKTHQIRKLLPCKPFQGLTIFFGFLPFSAVFLHNLCIWPALSDRNTESTMSSPSHLDLDLVYVKRNSKLSQSSSCSVQMFNQPLFILSGKISRPCVEPSATNMAKISPLLVRLILPLGQGRYMVGHNIRPSLTQD